MARAAMSVKAVSKVLFTTPLRCWFRGARWPKFGPVRFLFVHRFSSHTRPRDRIGGAAPTDCEVAHILRPIRPSAGPVHLDPGGQSWRNGCFIVHFYVRQGF